MWALKILHEKNWRVSLCIQELYHPRDFLWILAAIPVFRNTTGLTVLNRGLRFFNRFWILGWLGQQVSPFFPLNMFTWHSYWIGIYPTQIFPCSSPTVAWHSWRCHGWWGRRAWGKRRMIEEGKLEEELVDKPGTTIGTKISVLRCIRIPFLMRCGFLTVDPFIRVSVFIAKLSERQYCWRILEDFHCQEYLQLFDINCGLFMRLHFSIGCYDCRGTSRRRQGIHFSRIQVLFAGYVHRRSRVDNKLSFLRFKIWWRKQAPIFWRWEECCFIFLL